MESDIKIAQQANMEHITKIADKLNLSEDDIELYGKYKCKISLEALKEKQKNHREPLRLSKILPFICLPS